MNQETCPCCFNHCNINHLKCEKGQNYFQTSNSQEKKNLKDDLENMSTEEKAIYAIRKCGHFLHHTKEEVHLNNLTEEEQQQLIDILFKCFNSWEKNHF